MNIYTDIRFLERIPCGITTQCDQCTYKCEPNYLNSSPDSWVNFCNTNLKSTIKTVNWIDFIFKLFYSIITSLLFIRTGYDIDMNHVFLLVGLVGDTWVTLKLAGNNRN